MTQHEFSFPQKFDVFVAGDADAIRSLLIEKINERCKHDPCSVFRTRGTSLIGTVLPALTWMRDNYGVPISIDSIRFGLQLRSISTLVQHRIFRAHNILGGSPIEYRVLEMPENLFHPLQVYLGEIPGYDTSADWDQQNSGPAEQHGYALMYFTRTFTQQVFLRAAK